MRRPPLPRRRSAPYAVRVLAVILPLLMIAVLLAVFTYEPEESFTPRPHKPRARPPGPTVIERAIGCGLTWERSWAFIEEGTSAEEVRRCLGEPDGRVLRTFDSIAVAQELSDLRSGRYMGPGPAEAFMLGLLPHGAEYKVWGWSRSEKVNMRYYDRVDVNYTVYVAAAGCAEECVIEKRRNVPLWESFRVY